ncbi:MAG: InlB B-repeat-containing protein, partial [Clostridia bacterium]|nr:InlB B-repeat-containing protein [Clostridia bacterium]
MKKLSRILLVVLIIGLLATVFSACSALSKFQYQAPSDVPGGQGTSSGEKYDEEYPAYLKFTYKTQSPSVFKHIYIDEFNLEDVQYQVVYYVNKTDPQTDDFYEGYITKEDPQPVTKDMLDAASQKNLKVAGHHMIFVSTTIVFNGEETDVEGSFVLHLKERSQTEFVTFTFNLNGGNALFGSTTDDVATISVIKGTSYSASDFFSTFNAVKDGYALAEWTGFSGNITADGDKTFTAKWTSDVIKVTFDLNLPDGVAGNPSAYTSEPVVPAPQNVQKNKGLIPRPSIETFATLTGYSFVGWFTSKTGGENWNFNESVGSVDMTLYAQWEVRTCSVTYILMGGVFDEAKSDTTATIKADGKISYVNGYKEGEAGYNPDLTSNLMTDYPFMFTVEGMTYNQPYANYYAEFAPKRDSESLFKVNASPENLISQLKKGDNYYYISGWYESPTYEEESRYTSDKVSGNVVLYAKWEINPEVLNPTTTAQIEKSEKYFGEYLYNYSVKADGSVRIDMVRDSAISTLVIPEKIDGKPVSEFGAQAGMNLKSLVKVDATKATSLVSIGKQAFYNSYALKEVEVATNIEYVGEDAFKGTQWLDSLAEEGSFAVVGSVLIKCFDFESESVNIDTALPELANVKIIAGGAFKDYYLLKSVTIGDGIKQI